MEDYKKEVMAIRIRAANQNFFSQSESSTAETLGGHMQDTGTAAGELLQLLGLVMEKANQVGEAFRHSNEESDKLVKSLDKRATSATLLLARASNSLGESHNNHCIDAIGHLREVPGTIEESMTGATSAQSEILEASQIARAIPDALEPIATSVEHLKAIALRISGVLKTTAEKSDITAGHFSSVEMNLKEYEDNL